MPRQTLPTVQVAVVDTNVFLRDPHALFNIQAELIIVPFCVLEELDALTDARGSTGRNSQQAIHMLEALRLKGDIHAGVPINDEVDSPRLQITSLDATADTTMSTDETILATIQHYHAKGVTTRLYSQNINLRMRAGHLGINSRDFKPQPLALPHEVAAVLDCPVPSKILKAVTQSKVFSLLPSAPLFVNQFIRLHSENNEEAFRLFRFVGGENIIEVHNKNVFGLFNAKNAEQAMALDLLLDDSVKLVSLIGQAGTGKTFLALLAGLAKMLNERVFQRIMVTRPTVALGPDIGFLPGDMDEKLENWMQPVFDNISMIIAGTKAKKMSTFFTAEDLIKNKQLVLQAITYMRGRSLPRQFLFVDEAQNLTPLEVKTLVTRAGAGTKVILAGDPDQIDTKALNYDNNGLMVTTKKFRGESLFGVVHLKRSERSELAQRAADLL